jgi:hypothetical protein
MEFRRGSAGRGAALQVGPVGGRSEHDAVQRDPDGVRASADQDQTQPAEPAQVVEQSLDRIAVTYLHRSERHLDPGESAVTAADSHGRAVGGQVGQPAVARAEPVHPADQPRRRHLDFDAAAGHRPAPGHNPDPASNS